MLTPKEAFFEIYHQAQCKNDIDKYNKSVLMFEDKYKLKAPYKNYYSFKVSMGKFISGSG